MDDDQDSSFADLLARSTAPQQPTSLYTQDDQDPWANPFASGGVEVSPYVTQLENDGVIEPEPELHREVEVQPAYQVDPPSVIVQQEREDEEEQAMLAALRGPSQSRPTSTYQSQPSPIPSPAVAYQADPFVGAPTSAPKAQPADDLLGLDQYVDPSEALKKAFVKSTSKSAAPTASMSPQKKVVNRGKRGIVAGVPAKPKVVEQVNKVEEAPAKEERPGDAKEDVKSVATEPQTTSEPPKVAEAANVGQGAEVKGAQVADEESAQVKPTDAAATESVPSDKEQSDMVTSDPNSASSSRPTSAQTTPTPAHHPLPPSRAETPTPTLSRSETPSRPDRVITSPLDTPSGSQSSFAALSIGASSSGKGWAAIDGDDDEGGLFGKGFVPPALPSASSASPWGAAQTGWGDEESSYAEPPRPATPPMPTPASPQTPVRQPSSPSTNVPSQTPQTPSRQKPLFSISVGDPTKVGDPIRGHIVYTIRTRTTSPHFHRGDFSALRRFSDFLWLFEALTLNNPGVIVPPVPDKHPFGRFQDQFVETRRLALERCLRKMCAHPVLQLDPDLKLFLESDSFAIDIKQRKLEMTQEKQGYLASWTGPKYFEQDEWFDSRKIFLDSLETQLKALVKSIDTTSKQRLELALNIADFADSIALLADSDLGSSLSSALARLADLAKQEKETYEEQAKADVVHIMSSADEYLRLIASVRLAFASRIKAWVAWQNAEKDVVRIRAARDKARQQGRSTAEGEGERRAREAAAEFEDVSRLVKSEFARFEKERVEEFKRMMERYLDGMVSKQKELIKAWEEYHGVILKMVQTSQAQRQTVVA